GAERERTPRGNNRRRGIVVERTGGPYPAEGVQSPKSKVQSLENRTGCRVRSTEHSPAATARQHGESRITHEPRGLSGHASRLPVPLNVHSYYSFLDSTLPPQAIVDFAARHDLPA